jgi:DNA-binding NarL/FixJ family response regulator
MLRVLLADDHQIVREGFRALLDRNGFAVVAEADDGEQASQLIRVHRPDVAVLDQSMPRRTGVECARGILTDDPKAAVVLLTVHADEHQVVAALRVGIRGYVVKTQAAAELVSAIREVHAGGIYLSARVSHALRHVYLDGAAAVQCALTARQLEVLKLIAEGKSAREIAAALQVSPKAVELHRARIVAKLGIRETAGLVRYAIRSGLTAL